MQTSTNFFFSKILYKNIHNIDDSVIGTLHDLVVDFSASKPKVRAIVVKNGKREFFVTSDSLQVHQDEHAHYHVRLASPNLEFIPVPDNDIFLARDFLDKQIIDIEGKKVERVNDVRIASIRGKWSLLAVDIGFRGLMRRLGVEYPAIWISTMMKRDFHNNLVVWDDVQPLTHGKDNLRLNSSLHKLNTLHAADLADILEDLDKQTQVSLFQSLEPEMAADVLEEVETDVQVSLIENISIENASDVLELMPPDEAADILDDLDENTAKALLEDMESDSSEEIRELMEYEDKTVGSLMMNEFLSFHIDDSAGSIIRSIKRLKPSEDISHYLYIVDDANRLIGVVSLLDLLRANPKTIVEKLLDDDQETVMLMDIDPVERAMERMLKYNLMILPVVDENMTLVGITSLNDLVYEYGYERRMS